MSALDPELLEAFVPEFLAGCDRLAAAPDAAGAARALDGLRGMASSFEIASLGVMLAAATAALDPYEPDMPARSAAELRAQALAIAEAGADLPAPATAAGIRVLIVDDSALMRRLVREALAEDADVTVVAEAADGAAALAAMDAHRPDVTLLDIEMPVLDGFGVLRRRALAGGAGTVVVVSSAARPGSAASVALRRLGAQGVVGKPSGAFSPDLAARAGAAIRRAVRAAALAGRA